MSSPLQKRNVFSSAFVLVFASSLYIGTRSSRGCGSCGKLGAYWAQSFPWLPQPGFCTKPGWEAWFCFSLTARVTDCYSWPDTRVSAHSRGCGPLRAIAKAPGPLSQTRFSEHRRRKSILLVLFALLTVEAFPGAGGLLCGQRSCRAIRPQDKGPLLF